MGRPRTPAGKAKVTGAADKNPKRYAAALALDSAELGEPSEFLDDFGKAAWVQFKREIPWLKESHRALMELACNLRGQMFGKTQLKSTDVKTYAALLSKLGATPSDEGRIADALGWQTPPAPGVNAPDDNGNGEQAAAPSHRFFD